LQCDNSQVSLCGIVRKASESHRIDNRLYKQTNRGDSIVVDENFKAIFYACHRLIANGNEICKIQITLLQRQIKSDIATLTNDRRTKSLGLAAVLIGPQGDAVESIDVAVTVWPEQRHFSGYFNEFLLQSNTVDT
jgi:hypothetical protein